MVVIWCLITILVVIFSTSQLISLIISYIKFPEITKEMTTETKNKLYISATLHTIINIIWIALVILIDSIRENWIAITITAVIMIIIVFIVIHKKGYELEKDYKSIALNSIGSQVGSKVDTINSEFAEIIDEVMASYNITYKPLKVEVLAKKKKKSLIEYLKTKERYNKDILVEQKARSIVIDNLNTFIKQTSDCFVPEDLQDFQGDITYLLKQIDCLGGNDNFDTFVIELDNKKSDITEKTKTFELLEGVISNFKNLNLKIKQVYAGEIVNFSKYELMMSAINLQSLKSKLDEEIYKKVELRVKEYETNPEYKIAEPYNLHNFIIAMMNIQDEFSEIIGVPLNWDGTI